MSEITDRIETLVKAGATVEVRLANGQVLEPWPIIYAELSPDRQIRWWLAALNENLHAQNVETWASDEDTGELIFHCDDDVIVTLGTIWRPDHRAILDAFRALPGLENIPYPRDTGSRYG